MLSVEELLKKYPCTHTETYFQTCHGIERAASLNKRTVEISYSTETLKPFEFEELSKLGYRVIRCSRFMGTNCNEKIFSYWYVVSW